MNSNSRRPYARPFPFLTLLLSLVCISGCASLIAVDSPPAEGNPRIDRVFFAQQHVLEPSSPNFKLVGNLEALVKVQVYADRPIPAPEVYAVLTIGDKVKDLRLRGPALLPQPYQGDPVLMPHRYDDSFTAMIPREWVQPGLRVAIELRDYDYVEAQDYDRYTQSSVAVNSIELLDRHDLGQISVGAPSRLVMNMFDFHYFGGGVEADHPTGWEAEFEARIPVSEMVVHRVRRVMLNEIVWMPFAGQPSMLLHNLDEAEAIAGQPLDGEQAMALRWSAALKRAAGHMGPWRLYYLNICGMHAGGQAGGFRACGSIHRNGVIIHEVGHTFGLPHWNRAKAYPYKSTMYGQVAGEPTNANAGPTWGYDLKRRAFLPAYTKTDKGYKWAVDPMQGGGRYPGPEYIYRHFSDYSVHRIQRFLEERVVYWNDELGEYAKWNPETNAYDQVIANDGLQLPIERDVDVISLLFTPNLVLPDANIIYAPIGPYKAGLIERFDADSIEGRARAKSFGYDQKGYNVCLRVTQGGKATTYILDLKLSEDEDPLKAFHVGAINLPARDGEVTRAELLYTPDVVDQGVGPSAKVLYTWAE
jgi:hypothetical protein